MKYFFVILNYLISFRFYFVGDEDLLEIIGNSKNVTRLQKHFKKMFAGVSSIILNNDNSLVTGLTSKEGEEVHIFLCYFSTFLFILHVNLKL